LVLFLYIKGSTMNLSIKSRIFYIIIIYYWFLMYLQKPDTALYDSLYLVTVLPIIIFIILSFLTTKFDFKIDKPLIWILFFAIFSTLYAMIRFDLIAIASVLLFSSTIFILYYNRLSIYTSFLNKLFIISVILSIPLYYSGYSEYGFIPGQSSVSSTELLAGRISLFPNVTYSMYFSFMVFLYNIFLNTSKNKYVYIFLSLYFIIFGISRTLTMTLIFITVLLMIHKFVSIHHNRWLYICVYPLLFIALPFVMILNIESIFNFILTLDIQWINQYVFRGHTNTSDILTDMMRLNAWSEHIRIFFENIGGVSQVTLKNLINKEVLFASDTVAFLTRQFALYGLAAIFFVFFLASIFIKSIEEKNIGLYIVIFIFLFLSLLYGPFFSAYNIIFLLFISLINKLRESKYAKNC